MKIVHVLSPADAGGLERVVHALVIGQHRRGDQVIAVPIVESWALDHPFAGPLLRANVDLRPLVVPPRAYRKERAALRDLLRSIRPDVMHSHGYRTDVVCGDVARRAGVATVSTAHGFTRGRWRNRLYEYLDRRALRRFDAVVAVSQPLGDEFLRSGIAPRKLHVIPNAWSRISTPLDRQSARRDLGLAPAGFIAGWVGRMSHEKGLDTFVDALMALTDLPVTACIIGTGPDRDREEARAAARGLGERIRWAGLVREAGRYFAAFDVLVLSSRSEGTPMVVLEAMAEHVPLVVTAVGGIPNVVSPSEALLVPSENPAALAAAIRLVYDEPAASNERAAAAVERLRREFSEDVWLRRYQSVYERACEQRALKVT